MITILYSNTTRTTLPKSAFFRAIRGGLKKRGITDNVEVELQIVGRQSMRRLNCNFRGKDYSTDVLSFPIWHDLATIKYQSGAGRISLGTIVVCLPIAKLQAQKSQQALVVQINWLIQHSLEHLLGFHHEGD